MVAYEYTYFSPFPLLISFHRFHPYLPGDRQHFEVFNYSYRAARVGVVDDRLTNSSLPLSRRSTSQLHCLLQNKDAYHSIKARNLDRQGLKAMCITKISLVSLNGSGVTARVSMHRDTFIWIYSIYINQHGDIENGPPIKTMGAIFACINSVFSLAGVGGGTAGGCN